MRDYPAPIEDPATKPFWQAARGGVLLLGWCRDTGRHFWPPRPISPFTLTANTETRPASGQGNVYTFTVMRIADPYIPAFVELAEGPRIFTNLVDVAPEAVSIGMGVALRWIPTEGAPLPGFAPA